MSADIVKRSRGETPLFVVSVIIGGIIWLGAAVFAVAAFPVSLLVALYVLVFVGVYFAARVAFVSHVRGNGARIGPEQFAELHLRVQQLSEQLGLKRVPDAYLIQAGGALNALAMRFIRTPMVVLYSDLVEACGENAAARDMIIAHELCHIRAGHLRLRWLLLPSAIIPFLRPALSRAREYTCDLTGAACAGDLDGALLGLSLLATGGRFATRLNRASFAAQRRDLNTGWMTLGQWFSTHPPLARRMAAVDPTLVPGSTSSAGGTLRALSIILAGLVILVGGVYVGVSGAGSSGLGRLLSLGGLRSLSQDSFLGQDTSTYIAPESAASDLQDSFEIIGAFLDEEMAAGNDLPEDYEGLYERWGETYGDTEIPRDPYDGMEMGYEKTHDGYLLWSSGPDAEPQTEDDLTYEGPAF